MTMEARYGTCSLQKGKVLWTMQNDPFVPGADTRQMFFMIDCVNDGRDHNCAVRLLRQVRLLPTFQLVSPGPWSVRSSNQVLINEFPDLANGHELDHELKRSVHDRQDVVTALVAMGYDGWIGPTDFKPFDVEVCLFDTSIVEIIEYRDEELTSVQLDYPVACEPGTETFGSVPLERAKEWLQMSTSGWSVYDTYLEQPPQPHASEIDGS